MVTVTWERVLPSRGDVTQLCWPLPRQPSGDMAACPAARHVGLCQGQKDQAFQIDSAQLKLKIALQTKEAAP